MAKKLRIDKILSNLGYGSRAEIKRDCKHGVIEVNGKIISNPGTQVDPENDEILYSGERVEYREYIYIMMNKPDGYISATFDKRDPIVLDLIDDPSYLAFEPFPVGRLDKDTEGLLVLTNDGKLSHRVLSPKKHVPKTYYAKVEGVVSDEDIKSFEEGVVLDDGYKTMPSQLKILKSDELSEIELTIHEGKFHQVKRMFESVGKKVVYLKRLSMGKLKLDESLGLGEYRELTDEEVKLIEKRE
ncbi:pseudouridine synthase [Asaccharospora irregularis]|uniref:Pseudouridine synthase n=1 Tax=Asaccharospora irregularis DSM 2635 TaxID=1121321 RepID=A0A1M5QYC6_9FIRM|nr:pseudouridine synthase [Asaccharospora irregularis]SHH18770.1 16S rRNA pseudouridine516 synthase [Asaccharospora irregularis DSM 2635]